MSHRIIKGVFMASLIILFFIITAYFINRSDQIQYYLEVVNKKDNAILVKIEVDIGDKFYFEYVNSKDLNPVYDTFQIRENGVFCLLTEEYPWYGVGQECDASKEITYNNHLVKVNVNKEMKELPLRVAFIVYQKIRCNGEEYILSSLADGGTPIKIIINDKGGINGK